MERCVKTQVDRALEMEGTVTNVGQGEHGIDLRQKQFLLQELGEDTIDVMG